MTVKFLIQFSKNEAYPQELANADPDFSLEKFSALPFHLASGEIQLLNGDSESKLIAWISENWDLNIPENADALDEFSQCCAENLVWSDDGYTGTITLEKNDAFANSLIEYINSNTESTATIIS
jgi:hypothetical protein